MYGGGVDQLGFTIPVIGVDTDDITSAGGVIQSILSFGKTPNDINKGIWTHIPFVYVGVAGKEHHHTDSRTGEALSDSVVDHRRRAVMASGIGAHVADGDRWLDNATGAWLSSDETLHRWKEAYGTSDFNGAYTLYPSRFVVYGPNPAQDPPLPGQARGLPVSQLPVYAPGAAQTTGAPSSGGYSYPTTMTGAPSAAGFGGLSTGAMVAVVAVAAALLLSKRRR